ncbi:MAG: molybdopterin biosynthesis protein [Thermodesulfobacteriota bacterium]
MADYSTNIYLKKKSLTEARTILFEQFANRLDTGVETVPVPEAVGRVLAAGVPARRSSPAHHISAMDGIAVKAEQTFGAGESGPKTLAVDREAFFVNTGNLLPAGTNAVIMIEDVHVIDHDKVEIMAPAFPWQYVRKAGEDIVATELLFPTNHVVTPYCVGALLSAGVLSVPVRKKPRVLILPTGSELVEWKPGDDPAGLAPGRILESNSYMLSALVQGCSADPERHAIVPDEPEKIQQAVTKAVDSGLYHAVLLIGGSSAGARDYSQVVIERLGEIFVHGVTIMPGKPLIIGSIRSVPVFGMPGYPVSAVVCFEELVRPFLCRLQNLPALPRPTIPAILAKKTASRLGVEEFLRVKLGKVDDTIIATQLPRGAGSVTSLADADAFVRIPAPTEGLAEAQPVTAELLRPLSDIEQTVVAVGSHDNTLDVIADMIAAEGSGIKLASTHVGSMAGLLALARGRCHLAGSHLLDENTGEYNVSYIKKHLAGMPVKLVKLVSREQGLMVVPGNPKKIAGIADIARTGVTFINRQAGAGTRILLDFKLRELGIDPAAINGYANDEYTHMSVAIAVASGVADTGLGILAAARALGLDFIPVVSEEYDLIIPARFFDLPGIQTLLKVISSPAFADRVKALGGYGTHNTGKVYDLN